jgi:hypothetical protein
MINIINIHWINALPRRTISPIQTPGDCFKSAPFLLLDTQESIMIVETFSTIHPALDRLSRSYAMFCDVVSQMRSWVAQARLPERLMGAIDRHNQVRLEALAARDWRVQAELRAMTTRDL